MNALEAAADRFRLAEDEQREMAKQLSFAEGVANEVKIKKVRADSNLAAARTALEAAARSFTIKEEKPA